MKKGGQNVDKLSFACFKVKERKGFKRINFEILLNFFTPFTKEGVIIYFFFTIPATFI